MCKEVEKRQEVSYVVLISEKARVTLSNIKQTNNIADSLSTTKVHNGKCENYDATQNPGSDPRGKGCGEDAMLHGNSL